MKIFALAYVMMKGVIACIALTLLLAVGVYLNLSLKFAVTLACGMVLGTVVQIFVTSAQNDDKSGLIAQTLFGAVIDAVIAIDENGIIVSANPGVRRVSDTHRRRSSERMSPL
jgi:PAS domain-containing protein